MKQGVAFSVTGESLAFQMANGSEFVPVVPSKRQILETAAAAVAGEVVEVFTSFLTVAKTGETIPVYLHYKSGVWDRQVSLPIPIWRKMARE